MSVNTDIQTAIRELVASGRIERAVEAAMFQVGNEIMAVAKERTPVDLGNLKGSGRVEPPTSNGGELEVKLVFGNESIGYALVVHEDLKAHHDTGQAKFLESAILESANSFLPRVAAKVRL